MHGTLLTSKLKLPGLELSGSKNSRSLRSFLLSLHLSPHPVPYLKARSLRSSSWYYPPHDCHRHGLPSLLDIPTTFEPVPGRENPRSIQVQMVLLAPQPSFLPNLPTQSANSPHMHFPILSASACPGACVRTCVYTPVHLHTHPACREPRAHRGTHMHVYTLSCSSLERSQPPGLPSPHVRHHAGLPWTP